MSAALLRCARRQICYLSCRRSIRSYVATATQETLPPEIDRSSSTALDSERGSASSAELAEPVSRRQGRRRKTSVSEPKAKADAKSRSPHWIPEPNPIELYLARIHSEGLEPTLEDVERCRPKVRPDVDHPKYADQYNGFVDMLSRSFSKDQLRKFCIAYELGPRATRSTRRKAQYATSILEEKWGWLPIADVETRRREKTEIVVKSFGVDPSQLFNLLGKDGIDMLHMSIEFNVHISVTSNPLALRVEGVRSSIEKIRDRLTWLKETMLEELFDLPTERPIRQDLVQVISRLSGTYVEQLKDKPAVRLCAKDWANIEHAKRLIPRAVCETECRAEKSLLTYVPADTSLSPQESSSFKPRVYSLFPFTSTRPVPWTSFPGSAFRLRRVADWLSTDHRENVGTTGGLLAVKENVATTTQELLFLKDALCMTVPPEDAPDSEQHVTASIGHVALTSPSHLAQPSFAPPVQGSRPLADWLRWISTSDTRETFIPSLPPLLLNSPPAEQRIIHRLYYRALRPTASLQTLPGDSTDPQRNGVADRVLKFEVVLNDFSPRIARGPEPREQAAKSTANVSFGVDSSQESTMDKAATDWRLHGEPGDTFALATDGSTTPVVSEAKSEDAGTASAEQQESGEVDPLADNPVPMQLELESSCRVGRERIVDLMMPNRVMDLRFTVFDSTAVTMGDRPAELISYVNDLNKFLSSDASGSELPKPPLSLRYEDDDWYLTTSASVRQGLEYTSNAGRHSQQAAGQSPAVQVLSESALDLESNQKSVYCQISCTDTSSVANWQDFLKNCDRLTISP